MFALTLIAGCSGELDGVLKRDHIRALDTNYRYATYVHPDAQLEEGSPWLLLLDGDQGGIDGAAGWLDREVRAGRAQPFVIVGIGKEKTRERDFTPIPVYDENNTRGYGGIEPFFRFLRETVVPKAETELGIGGSPEDRALAGHSFGGLATLWAVSNDRATYRRFAASSPSLWWDDGSGLGFTSPEGSPEGPPAMVFASVGANEDQPLMLGMWQERAESESSLDITTRMYEGHGHFTVVERAFPDAFSTLWPAP